MNINLVNNPNILRAYGKNQPYAATPAKAAGAMDEVSFSKEALSFAKTLAEVREAAPQVTSPERQAKLDELSEQISSGQYQVNGEEVADALIADILSRYQA